MSKQSIRKNIQQLRKKIEQTPKVWRFHGRPVVPVEKWRFEDWSTFPDQFTLILMGADIPKDWRKDYNELMNKIRDPEYANQICGNCAIQQTQDQKEQVARLRWGPDNGGEEAQQKFYDECGKVKAAEFRRRDAFEQVKLGILNELAGANDRTCNVLNFFKCPYGNEHKTLINDGKAASELLEHLEWYDGHWNPNSNITPAQNQMKWYHYGQPGIIDVTNLDDIKTALADGRISKIAAEHERYMKETE